MALSISVPAFADGTIEDVIFYSDALGKEKPVQVYLPDGYDTSGLEYPVLYLLTEPIGPMATTILATHLDQMTGTGLIDPMIVVSINGACMPYSNWGFPMPMSSWWRNSELSGAWKDALVTDLVTWVDSASGYRTLANPHHRYVAGHYLGGGAAMMTALEFPEIFGAVTASNGNAALEVYEAMLPMMLATEYPGGPPYEYRPDAGPLSFSNFMLAAAFTPNVTASPWPIDFWLDSDGDLIPEVWQRFVNQTSPVLARDFAATGGNLDIFFDCDSFGIMVPACNLLHTTMDDLEIPHVVRGYADQSFSDRVPVYLTFFHPLNATVELSPRMMNGRHWWPLVTATIELPDDLDVADIDTMTLAITRINGDDLDRPIRALVANEISDLNGNGRDDLTVWFWKPLLLRRLSDIGIEEHEPFDVTIEGETTDGWFLAATDEQRAINMKVIETPWTLWPLAVD